MSVFPLLILSHLLALRSQSQSQLFQALRKVSELKEMSASDTNEDGNTESAEAHSEGYQTPDIDYEVF